KVTYKSSNKKIATVSKKGVIKGKKKGTATITIKSGKITKKCKVKVK
ncbi:MAG: Ig-like domain-containing protein, partial [Blautia faecis]